MCRAWRYTCLKRDEPKVRFASWRWCIAPALVALVLALVFSDPFIGDWDGLDYTLSSIKGSPSSMALGRSLFIFTNRAAWRTAHTLFGLSAENAYLLFKYMVVAESPLAVIACWALARDVTGSVHAATIAALLIATSPFYIIYSGQVMTEIPALLLVAIACTSAAISTHILTAEPQGTKQVGNATPTTQENPKKERADAAVKQGDEAGVEKDAGAAEKSLENDEGQCAKGSGDEPATPIRD